MNGVLNVYKPSGMTSFDVIHILRKILKTKKIGHTGTLDPDATGVLVICVGRATKFIPYIVNDIKSYSAKLTLGIETDTQDASGNIIKTHQVDVSSTQITHAFEKFNGRYMQIPPMYSAIKVNGKKLYDLARKGITTYRAPREVYIHSLKITKIKTPEVWFDVVCSKGTYIRTLCSDIGNSLGCYGHMSQLNRTRVGKLDINDSLSIEEISKIFKDNKINDILLPVDHVLADMDILDLPDISSFIHGRPTYIENVKNVGLVKVYNNKKFIGIGYIDIALGTSTLKMKKLWDINLS